MRSGEVTPAPTVPQPDEVTRDMTTNPKTWTKSQIPAGPRTAYVFIPTTDPLDGQSLCPAAVWAASRDAANTDGTALRLSEHYPTRLEYRWLYQPHVDTCIDDWGTATLVTPRGQVAFTI